MKTKYTFIIDFDSTFTQSEAMEELAAISLKNDPEREVLTEQIKTLTLLAMEGKMAFEQSLTARIALLSAKKYHIYMLVNRLRQKITPSFAANRNFFKENASNILIVSGGFEEFIIPVVKPYGILPQNVYANQFVFDTKNNIVGANQQNLLAKNQGKVKLLKKLKLKGSLLAIGDGYTDLEMYEHKVVQHFFAFSENISRKKVTDSAPNIAASFDDILYQLKLPMQISYPKSRIGAVCYGKNTFGVKDLLEREGYVVSLLNDDAKFPEVADKIGQNKILIIDSALTSNAKIFKSTNNLLAAAVWGGNKSSAFAEYLQGNGVPLFEPSYAHTRSVAELALYFTLHLSRRNQEELKGKKLGIVGYGHAGSMLSVFTETLGMEVLYFDENKRPPIGNAQPLSSIQALFRKSDIIVLTAGKRFGSTQIINKQSLKWINSNSLLVNLSYDETVDINLIIDALDKGKIGGFAMDCLGKNAYNLLKSTGAFITFNSRIATRQTSLNMDKLISDFLISFINSGSTQHSTNFPNLTLPAMVNVHRFIHIHHNMAGILASLNDTLAKHKLNILGQYLGTNANIGYVITDVAKAYDESVINALKNIKGTIKFRVLY